MPIETTRTGASNYGQYIKLLLGGVPGSGKTITSSTFPDAFYASAEGGLMSVADRNVAYTSITKITQLLELKEILSGDTTLQETVLGFRPKTVVIDTIDEVQRIMAKERMVSERVPALRMQDYGWLGDQMRSLVRGFRNLDVNLVLTVHLKETKDDDAGTVVYTPGMVGAFANEVAGYVDISGVLKGRTEASVENNRPKKTIVRHLVTFPDPQYPWLKDRSGKLPGEFSINFEDDYERMHALIYGNVPLVDQLTLDVVNVPEVPEVMPEAVIKGKFECAECATKFDSDDQAALSKMRARKVLCKPCYELIRK